MMQIGVRLVREKEPSSFIDLPQEATVGDLRKAVAELFGAPVGNVRLLFEKRILQEDSRSLESESCRNESVVAINISGGKSASGTEAIRKSEPVVNLRENEERKERDDRSDQNIAVPPAAGFPVPDVHVEASETGWAVHDIPDFIPSVVNPAPVARVTPSVRPGEGILGLLQNLSREEIENLIRLAQDETPVKDIEDPSLPWQVRFCSDPFSSYDQESGQRKKVLLKSLMEMGISERQARNAIMMTQGNSESAWGVYEHGFLDSELRNQLVEQLAFATDRGTKKDLMGRLSVVVAIYEMHRRGKLDEMKRKLQITGL
jgi:hypothetical protein